MSKMKVTKAFEAFVDHELVYLDNIRYYSKAGLLRLKPRGKVCTYSVSDDGENYIFRRPGAQFNNDKTIPLFGEVFGLGDVWYSSEDNVKSPAVSSTAIYGGQGPFVVTADEWYYDHLDAKSSLIVDCKIVLQPLGNFGLGRGVKTADPTVTKRGATETSLDETYVAKTAWYEVQFANHESFITPRDVENKVMEETVTTLEPIYENTIIPSLQKVYCAHGNYIFTSEELYVQCGELGLINRYVPPHISETVETIDWTFLRHVFAEQGITDTGFIENVIAYSKKAYVRSLTNSVKNLEK